MTEQIPYEIECPRCGRMLKQHKERYGYVYVCSGRLSKKHPKFDVIVCLKLVEIEEEDLKISDSLLLALLYTLL